ncbi:MAG: thiamine pyrophosphate-binding protein, partial [Aestuariivirgaceae bacterium]
MQAEPRKRAADVLARRLYAAGCRHAFGMPGGEVLTLLDAFVRAGIEFHLAKHENAGGFMAEGTWHVSGAPAVLLATIGPGLTNAVNVVANASQDRVPLIVISGAIDAAEAPTYTHQVIDHREVLKSLVKGSYELNASAAGAIADKAVKVAMEMRCGPVHIDVPIAVATAPADDYPWQRVPLEPVTPVEGKGLAAARQWLSGAERPLLIIGHDAVLDGSAGQLREVVAQTDIPVLTTYKAKGIIPEDDPHVAGSFSLSPLADAQLQPLVSKADVVVLAGFDPIEVRTGWRNPFDLERQKVIEFAGESNDHYVHHSSVSFVCHTGSGVTSLCSGIGRSLAWPGSEPDKARAVLATAYGQGEAWGPAAITAEVRKILPRNGV